MNRYPMYFMNDKAGKEQRNDEKREYQGDINGKMKIVEKGKESD